MMALQQRLASSLPAFKPYATMTQEDIDECGDGSDGVAAMDGASIREDIQSGIREGIREGVRGGAQAAKQEMDAAAEAEAASTR